MEHIAKMEDVMERGLRDIYLFPRNRARWEDIVMTCAKEAFFPPIMIYR
jgi:hypothetical protein